LAGWSPMPERPLPAQNESTGFVEGVRGWRSPSEVLARFPSLYTTRDGGRRLCDLGCGRSRSRGAMVRIMMSVRVTAPVSMAFAALLLVTTPAAMAAVEQDGSPAEPSTVSGEAPPPRADPHDRPFLAVLGAIPLVTYAGASGPRESEVLMPADRFAM